MRGAGRRLADIGLSAFSLFFMQSGSFLSYQRALEEGRKLSNCRTLFGMAAVPTDNHIRAMLDPVHPSHLQPAFDGVLEAMRRRDGFAPFRRLGGRVLIALDGTEYFCSQKLGCPQCLTRKRSNGKIESHHSMLCATVVAPGGRSQGPRPAQQGGVASGGHAMALPLMPEFIAPKDGAEKLRLRAQRRQTPARLPRGPREGPEAGLPRRRPVRLPAGGRRQGGRRAATSC